MKRLLALVGTAVLFTTAAHATKTTIEYTPTEGDVVTIQYDDETNLSTNVATGESAEYTYAEEEAKICGSATGEEVCVTFDNPGEEVGHESAFSTNDGRSGTAKITAVE